MGEINEEAKRPDDLFVEGRRKLPKRRKCLVFKKKINRSSFFFSVGFYPDGKPGEIFMDNLKTGSDVNDTVNAMAILSSLALQYGCPAEKIIVAFRSFKEGCIPKVFSELLEEAVSEEAINDTYKTREKDETP